MSDEKCFCQPMTGSAATLDTVRFYMYNPRGKTRKGDGNHAGSFKNQIKGDVAIIDGVEVCSMCAVGRLLKPEYFELAARLDNGGAVNEVLRALHRYERDTNGRACPEDPDAMIPVFMKPQYAGLSVPLLTELMTLHDSDAYWVHPVTLPRSFAGGFVNRLTADGVYTALTNVCDYLLAEDESAADITSMLNGVIALHELADRQDTDGATGLLRELRDRIEAYVK
jgi:hypothetical protein